MQKFIAKLGPLKTIGLAVAIVWVILLALTAQGRVCEPQNCVARFWDFVGDTVWFGLYRWQTLLTGGIAILAAFIGGSYLKRQMDQADRHHAAMLKQTEDQHKDERRRARASARAMLVFALDALTDYVEECANALKTMRLACRGTSYPRDAERPPIPSIPTDVVGSLQRMIEGAEPHEVAQFKTIVNKMQVFDARLTDLVRRHDGGRVEKIVTSDNIESFILNAVEIHAMASMLFAFAREETDDLPTVPMIATQHPTSLHVLGFREHEFPTLVATMRRRVNRMLGIETPQQETPHDEAGDV
jgi:hypothetical protein